MKQKKKHLILLLLQQMKVQIHLKRQSVLWYQNTTVHTLCEPEYTVYCIHLIQGIMLENYVDTVGNTDQLVT